MGHAANSGVRRPLTAALPLALVVAVSAAFAQVPPPKNPAQPAPAPMPAPAETLPSPQRLDPFGPDRVRLPSLPGAASGPGVTPRPSPEVLKEYSQFIERTIDPQNVLDLVIGRPRILVLK